MRAGAGFRFFFAGLAAGLLAAQPALGTGLPTKIGKGEGALDIVAWPGYIERGETDRAYDWVIGFEKETGCKVSVKVASTSDEMVALMDEGGFDLVTASGDASLRLIASKRVQPVNIALIKSWAAIDPRLQDSPWHTAGGVHYGVPYQWGSNVLMYNKTIFKDPPKSWSVVFEESPPLADGKSNKGRIQAFDNPIYIADAALFLMKHRPELGILDPYELTALQYKAALDVLRVQRGLIQHYWHDATGQIEDFAQDGAIAASSWPYQVNQLHLQQKAVGSVIPEEGATGWADTIMLASAAAHPNCAYLWLEHSLDLKVQGDIAAWFGSVPAVPAACKGNALLTDMGCETNGAANFDKIKFWKTPQAKCPSQREGCVPYYRWATDYIAVIGGR